MATAGLQYRLTIHDYAPICPRITMVDWGGSYCASPSAQHCRLCIGKVGTQFGPVDIDDWRAAYARIVAGAETKFNRFFCNAGMACETKGAVCEDNRCLTPVQFC